MLLLKCFMFNSSIWPKCEHDDSKHSSTDKLMVGVCMCVHSCLPRECCLKLSSMFYLHLWFYALRQARAMYMISRCWKFESFKDEDLTF